MRLKHALLPVLSLLAPVGAQSALGAQISGRVSSPPAAGPPSVLGYSRALVALPSAESRSRRADLAIFLKVRDSLPLPEAEVVWKVELVGNELRPRVVSCALDDVVEFTNHERRSVTISVGGTLLGKLEPNASMPFPCRQGGRAAVTVSEMPFLEGSLYVGESVGIAARPDATGRFVLEVPKGTYELRILGHFGALSTKEVAVDRADVDLGTLEIEAPAATAPEAVLSAPPLVPAKAPEAGDAPSPAHDKVKSAPPPVPVPKPAKLKLEKPEIEKAAPSPSKAKPPAEPKPKASPPSESKPKPSEPKATEPKATEPKATEPRGSEEPPPAKIPPPTKPKAEKKKAEDDFFELEP